jgi:hypothetical protein
MAAARTQRVPADYLDEEAGHDVTCSTATPGYHPASNAPDADQQHVTFELGAGLGAD